MFLAITGPILQAPALDMSQEGINELSNIALGCSKYGLVCTQQGEFDKFAIAICIFGMLLGAICILMFQYTRKKAEEKIATDELTRASALAEFERSALK